MIVCVKFNECFLLALAGCWWESLRWSCVPPRMPAPVLQMRTKLQKHNSFVWVLCAENILKFTLLSRSCI